MSADDVLLQKFLVDAGLVGRAQLDALPREQQSLAEALVARGILGHDEVRRATAHALGVPFVELDPHDINLDAMLLVPEPLARAHTIFAYNMGDHGLEVAVLDLSALDALGDLGRTHRILPRLTSGESMRRALLHYQKHLRERFGDMLTNGQHMAEALISHALYSRAGGVHVDLTTMGTLVRYQVGHALNEAMRLPEQAGKQLVSQLKLLAKILPVARAQEGKFKIEKNGHIVNVRVHSLPTQGGERLRLRLAHAADGAKGFTLESLGFHGEAIEDVEKILHERRGVIAVAGQGKTTLIRTLEDLVKAPHLVSIEAYAATLRAALKHDPDVLVVDDIADTQTAALAGSAGERGVLAFAAEAGEEVPHARLRVRQTLVRRLCTKTFADMRTLSRREQDTLAGRADFVKVLAALKEEGVLDKGVAWKDVEFAHAVPCSECKKGYDGQVGLQEVRDGRGLLGLTTIEDGLFKAAQGITSMEEVLGLL